MSSWHNTVQLYHRSFYTEIVHYFSNEEPFFRSLFADAELKGVRMQHRCAIPDRKPIFGNQKRRTVYDEQRFVKECKNITTILYGPCYAADDLVFCFEVRSYWTSRCRHSFQLFCFFFGLAASWFQISNLWVANMRKCKPCLAVLTCRLRHWYRWLIWHRYCWIWICCIHKT